MEKRYETRSGDLFVRSWARCGAFPWIGGAQQEKQMVFGLEGLC